MHKPGNVSDIPPRASSTAPVTNPLIEALAEEERAFREASPASALNNEFARARLPGGSTRQALYYEPYPLTIVRGSGAFVYDPDGRRYLDLVGEFTAGVYGHDPDLLHKIVCRLEEIGLFLGGPTEYEGRFAELICSRFPSCELIRFCNSGTEANLFSILLARRATGRSAVLIFDGAYHGGVLNFDSDAGFNVPLDTVRARYNDIEGTRSLIQLHGDDLAAVVVEPVMGAGGCIPADPPFLEMLRTETEAAGINLIFDEVMSSRLGPGGIQGLYGIQPDLTTFGKYMGGGFSFGAFGGKTELMERLDPASRHFLPHSGTFNNNAASMIAGYYSLKDKYTQQACVALNLRGEKFKERLCNAAEDIGAPVQITGIGAVMNLHFQTEPISNPTDIRPRQDPLRTLYHLWMLNRGFYVSRRGMISLSMAMSEADLNGFVEAFARFLSANFELLKLEQAVDSS